MTEGEKAMTEVHNPIDVIHAELLGQLRDIVKVCTAHNIPYNLMCGTLLGAVRHKGFIPWDDDVDLLMTRDAFAEFEKYYPKECDDKYLLTYLNTWTPRVMSKNPRSPTPSRTSSFWIICPRRASAARRGCCICGFCRAC